MYTDDTLFRCIRALERQLGRRGDFCAARIYRAKGLVLRLPVCNSGECFGPKIVLPTNLVDRDEDCE